MTTALLDAGGHMRWPQWLRRWRCRRTVHASLLVAGMLLRIARTLYWFGLMGPIGVARMLGWCVLPVPSSLTRVACLAPIATGIA